MQILHRFTGSIQQYLKQISDPDHYRPDYCPFCHAKHALIARGFYSRTLVDLEFDDLIPVRRYLCRTCRRTVSLLPEFALPYLRFSISIISLFLVARLLDGCTLKAAAAAAFQPDMPYQRGQFWIRRFRMQAVALCGALATLTAAITAASFVSRALHILQSSDNIRFTALTVRSRMRLEILSPMGKTLFDSGFRPGNLIDWPVTGVHDSHVGEDPPYQAWTVAHGWDPALLMPRDFYSCASRVK